MVRIAIGSDHRGLDLKQSIVGILNEAGYTHQDFGSYTTESVDYPDIARQVGEAVASDDFEYGILICGTGIGMSIAANKVKGIRAALCHNAFGAGRARQHNDANILCMSAEEANTLIPEIVKTVLTTDFEGGRHQRRVNKIMDIEC